MTIYIGDDGNNNAAGSAGSDSLVGNGGNDTLFGLDGADTLLGGDGADYLHAGTGADVVDAGAGDDQVVVSESFASVLGGSGSDLLTIAGGLSHNLDLAAIGFERVASGAGSDLLDGSGLSVSAEIRGGSGDDTLIGGSAGDYLYGDGGADSLWGGLGSDFLEGGPGADTYLIAETLGNDTIANSDTDGGLDVARLTALSTDDLTGISVSGTTLVLSFGAAASLSVSNYFLSSQYRIDQVQLADGTTLEGFVVGGAGADSLVGGAGNDALSGLGGADTLSGGMGNDLYLVDQAGDLAIEAEGAGNDTVSSGADYTLGDHLEHLILLSGAANGTGNGLANVLAGNAADNFLDGLGGADTLIGGAGDDDYGVDDPGDLVVEAPGEGTDRVWSSVGYTLGAELEHLTLVGALAIDGTGNELANALVGNDSANRLDGGAGADTLTGGGGDDTYVGGAGDSLVELAGGGFDRVESAVSYTLADQFEGLTLTGGAVVNGTGNAADNSIVGNGANNTLDGKGGADTLSGGKGHDTYVVNHLGDTVSELFGEGTDSVWASASHTLAANVELLNLTGSLAIDGTGNELANQLQGNAAANRLDGGAGADTLTGGGGDDTYVSGAGDSLVEAGGGGFDRVESALSYTLADQFEGLTLTGGAAIDGTGNAADNAIAGNGADNTLDGKGGADTLSGGQGNDVYVVNHAGDRVVELLGEGTDSVWASVSHTLAANVEYLSLTGVSAIDGTGNGLANQLLGNGAANRLDGGAGADTLTGGGGDDTYVVSEAGDSLVEVGGGGFDRVQSVVSYTLADQFEGLTLIGGAAINGTGNAADNAIVGNGANNTLDGKGGADTLTGGQGSDTYVVNHGGDQVVELAGQGSDTVWASVSHTLADQVEHLTLTGTAAIGGAGNGLANILTGNAGANLLSAAEDHDRLYGNDGNDTLDGGSGNDTVYGNGGNDSLEGGVGADSLAGGAGDDSYRVDDPLDAIGELAGEGTDTVRSALSITLADQVEHLELTGLGALEGTGNDLANRVSGNGSGNRLDGGAGNDSLFGLDGDDTLTGGGGIDALEGGAGNDRYEVDDSGDTAVELSGGGVDTVLSGVAYTLGAFVENLTLTGAGAIKGTGNASANTLTGNGGTNTLDGLAGADTLIGGAGRDTYVVNHAGDSVVEVAGEGTDLVKSSVSHSLAANVENLTLTGTAAAGTGNGMANVVTGNAADNALSGLGGNDELAGSGGADTLGGGSGNDTLTGGLGSDSLTGGAGADAFKFVAAGEGIDSIGDFVSETDKIQVVSANFDNLGLGPLDPTRFVAAGTPLATGDGVFVYDGSSGSLAFDADGNGAGAAVQIALLTGPKALSAYDIEVVAA